MIIFFDIDGTLITEDGKAVIPKSTTEALKEASERGHKLYINTGRTYSNVEDKIRQLGFDGYVCGCGTYIECEGKVQLDLEVPEEVALKIRELAYECNVNAAFEHRDAIYIDERVSERPGLSELKGVLKSRRNGVLRTHLTRLSALRSLWHGMTKRAILRVLETERKNILILLTAATAFWSLRLRDTQRERQLCASANCTVWILPIPSLSETV